MPLADEALQEIAARLAARPRHEMVRTLLYRLLVEGLDARPDQIAFERAAPEVRGRIDALLGRTLFELKSDLRREGAEAQTQLARYLAEREAATGQRFVGVATDGASFRAYELREGAPVALSAHETRPQEARALLAWLEGVVAVQDRLPADALAITAELGRTSAAFARAEGLLARAWAAVGARPEPALKRQLWARHLGLVYGKAIEDDRLWLQHTYLVTVAKAIAAGAMGFPVEDPGELLSGAAFERRGVLGAVEDDFFGWILDAPDGRAIVAKIAGHVARFDLGAVDVDLLKVLYESLVDPEQRHDLGEYYTPDWLALKTTRRALRDPARERALDPSCGSGSFLFHAIRLKAQALREGPTPAPEDEIAERCCRDVVGFDVHPVAVIFARVTVLLALGAALRRRRGAISIPVYLGDALQWNVRRGMERDLVVDVPEAAPAARRRATRTLRFPLTLCADPMRFDRVARRLEEASEHGESADAFEASLGGLGALPDERPTLRATYEVFDRLRREGRDHVWAFVARNLSRPVALSDGARVDVVVGNPPWLSYRFMARDMQRRFAEASRALGASVGPGETHLVTQTDLSGLFFARAAQLYLRPGGRIAMVLPLAAMTRGQFRAFRTGAFHDAPVAFDEAWILDNQDVAPVFRVPTCVLFAERTPALAAPVPAQATWFSGALPFKDAPEALADRALRLRVGPSPTAADFAARSPYREAFKNGATLFPRMLCLVERVEGGRLGADAARPEVRSRRSRFENAPWSTIPSLEGAVEADFLRPVLLGESLAPFRVVAPALGVLPVLREGDMLVAAQAAARGLPGLADWLRRCDALWATHGSARTTYVDNLDHYRKLTSQMPPRRLRVVYAASGSQPAAAVVRDGDPVVEHAAYWAPVETEAEARYLAAFLNSGATMARIAPLQPRGEQGPRHIDKLPFTLPFPRFDPNDPRHLALAAAGERAERVAAGVAIPEGATFLEARRLIREALAADGAAARVDALVEALLAGAPAPSEPAPALA